MDDYTPSTEDVRESYTYLRGTIPTVEHAAEFDRWLNEVKAEAWEEGAIFGVRDQHGTVDTYIRDAIERRNPYREED